MTLISFIIPVKNEPYLPTLIEQINSLPLDKEILIQSEPGVSNAVMTGIEKSRGDIIVVMDGDGDHNPKYVPEMIKMLDDADAVSGSRFAKGGMTQDETLYRRLNGLQSSRENRLLFLLKNTDPLSGFFVARRKVFDELQPLSRMGQKIRPRNHGEGEKKVQNS